MSEPKNFLRCLGHAEGPTALRQEGALIKVNIIPDPYDKEAVRAAKVPSVSAVLMIDTGASRTGVLTSLLDQFGLPSERWEWTWGVSPDPVDCPVYRMALEIPMTDDRVSVT